MVMLGVGEVAERSGLSISALHFQEKSGLVTSVRSAGPHFGSARPPKTD